MGDLILPKGLRFIGKVSHVSKKGNIIVLAENLPSFYSDVYDENNRKLGYVLDIIGPTKSPYVVVRAMKRIKIKKNTRVYELPRRGKVGKKRN